MSKRRPVVFISRTETFSAAHRLHSPQLTDEENRRVFGKCNNPHGHGHNYRLEVILRGPVDEKTGMVVNLTDLKEFIRKAVMEPLDHRNLDKEVPFFQQVASTTENVAVYVWQQMQQVMDGRIPSGVHLYEVRIHETDNNVVIYRGDEENE